MKKMILTLTLILTTTSVLAAEPGVYGVLNVSKNGYSKFMYLMLDCLSTKGLTTNYRLADLAFEHCKSEATTNLQMPIVYNNLPSPVSIDLDRFHNSTSDMIVCLGGVRGAKTSDSEAEQKSKDTAALKECDRLLLPSSGESPVLNRMIETP